MEKLIKNEVAGFLEDIKFDDLVNIFEDNLRRLGVQKIRARPDNRIKASFFTHLLHFSGSGTAFYNLLGGKISLWHGDIKNYAKLDKEKQDRIKRVLIHEMTHYYLGESIFSRVPEIIREAMTTILEEKIYREFAGEKAIYNASDSYKNAAAIIRQIAKAEARQLQLDESVVLDDYLKMYCQKPSKLVDLLKKVERNLQ